MCSCLFTGFECLFMSLSRNKYLIHHLSFFTVAVSPSFALSLAVILTLSTEATTH